MNVSSQVILQKAFTTNQQINLDLPTGVYFAKIKVEEKEVVKKLVIK